MADKAKVKRVELTDEQKAKLKGLAAITTENEFIYVPAVYRENDFPKELWPMFLLKGKNGIQMAEDEDNAGYMEAGNNRIFLTAGKKRLESLKKNIVNWKNFYDENGVIIPFKRDDVNGLVSNKVLERMPVKLQIELVNAINDRNTLTEEELQGLEF